MVSFCIELFCVVTLQYQILVRIAIAYFIIEKKKTAPQPWQAIAQRFCSIEIISIIIDRIYEKKVVRQKIRKYTELVLLDMSYNIMLIIAALVVKKYQNNDLVVKLINKSSNNTYILMWNRWTKK